MLFAFKKSHSFFWKAENYEYRPPAQGYIKTCPAGLLERLDAPAAKNPTAAPSAGGKIFFSTITPQMSDPCR